MELTVHVVKCHARCKRCAALAPRAELEERFLRCISGLEAGHAAHTPVTGGAPQQMTQGLVGLIAKSIESSSSSLRWRGDKALLRELLVTKYQHLLQGRLRVPVCARAAEVEDVTPALLKRIRRWLPGRAPSPPGSAGSDQLPKNYQWPSAGDAFPDDRFRQPGKPGSKGYERLPGRDTPRSGLEARRDRRDGGSGDGCAAPDASDGASAAKSKA